MKRVNEGVVRLSKTDPGAEFQLSVDAFWFWQSVTEDSRTPSGSRTNCPVYEHLYMQIYQKVPKIIRWRFFHRVKP